MESLPTEILSLIAELNNHLYTLMILSKVSNTLKMLVMNCLKREKNKYMLMESGATYCATMVKQISPGVPCPKGPFRVAGTKVRYTGMLAKKVVANDKGCVMIIGIDDFCYVTGKKTQLHYIKRVRGYNLYPSCWTRVCNKKVVQIVNNNYFNLFVTEDKELWGWGLNNNNAFNITRYSYRQRGNIPVKSVTAPTKLCDSAVIKVRCSQDTIVALLENGGICVIGRSCFKNVNFTQIASTISTFFGVDSAGRLWKFLSAGSGPVLTLLRNIKKIISGYAHIMIIFNDGTAGLYTGHNDFLPNLRNVNNFSESYSHSMITYDETTRTYDTSNSRMPAVTAKISVSENKTHKRGETLPVDLQYFRNHKYIASTEGQICSTRNQQFFIGKCN